MEFPRAEAPRLRLAPGQASALALPPEQIRDPNAGVERCNVQ